MKEHECELVDDKESCDFCVDENNKTFNEIFDRNQIEWPITLENFIEKFKQVWCKY